MQAFSKLRLWISAKANHSGRRGGKKVKSYYSRNCFFFFFFECLLQTIIISVSFRYICVYLSSFLRANFYEIADKHCLQTAGKLGTVDIASPTRSSSSFGPRESKNHYLCLVYTTQVNSTFRARWLASSEVINQVLFISTSVNNCWLLVCLFFICLFVLLLIASNGKNELKFTKCCTGKDCTTSEQHCRWR